MDAVIVGYVVRSSLPCIDFSLPPSDAYL